MAKAKERQRVQQVQRASFARVVTEVEQTCPVCKRTFWGARIRKYCSQPCRQRANYERHAPAYRQQRMTRYYETKET